MFAPTVDYWMPYGAARARSMKSGLCYAKICLLKVFSCFTCEVSRHRCAHQAATALVCVRAWISRTECVGGSYTFANNITRCADEFYAKMLFKWLYKQAFCWPNENQLGWWFAHGHGSFWTLFHHQFLHWIKFVCWVPIRTKFSSLKVHSSSCQRDKNCLKSSVTSCWASCHSNAVLTSNVYYSNFYENYFR
jgi:hypothetical protein